VSTLIGCLDAWLDASIWEGAGLVLLWPGCCPFTRSLPLLERTPDSTTFCFPTPAASCGCAWTA
jgi:hypothetical protein